MSYKQLVSNNILSKKEAAKLKDFYHSLNHESKITHKINVKGLDVDLIEYEGMKGVYFYLSRDGKDLFAVQLKISKI